MSQNDLIINNQSFPATRSDINSALQALASLNSGATAPSTTYANQLWYDTATNYLKMRSEANDAWITIGLLDQSANTFLPAGLNSLTQAEAEDDTSTAFGQVSGQRLAQAVAAAGVSDFISSSGTVTYTSSTTAVIPAGFPAFVCCVGAGGSGGAAGQDDSSVAGVAAAGGGAGGSAVKFLAASGSNRTLTMTIGSGGTSGQANRAAVAGGAGGSSSVTGTGISLVGGGGGGGGAGRTTSSGAVTASGASGGSASGGDINVTGGSTGNVTKTSGNAGFNVRAGAMVNGKSIAASSTRLTTTSTAGTVSDNSVGIGALDFSQQFPSLGAFAYINSSASYSSFSADASLGNGSGGATSNASDSATGQRIANSGAGGNGYVQIIYLRELP